MKRIATLTLAVCLLAVPAFAAIDGAWTASVDEKRPDRMYVSITRGHTNQMGMTMFIREFTGLSEAQIRATTMTPVSFETRREAGVTSYEGTFRNGKGAGQFTFTANRGYIDAIRALGLEFDLKRKRGRERSEEDELFILATHDVSTAFIKSMRAEGYKVPLEDYVAMRIHGVTVDYIREMRSLGFKELSHDDLVGSRIHGVTPQFVRDMRAAGWDLSLEDLQSSRIHGATPQFAAEMKKLGYGNLSHDELVSFRIHGVTAELIEELRQLGYGKVDADDLVSMRIHGVTPKYIRELAQAGYVKVPVEKLVSMRIHGIDAKFIKKMADD